jgi:hypothetical protein
VGGDKWSILDSILLKVLKIMLIEVSFLAIQSAFLQLTLTGIILGGLALYIDALDAQGSAETARVVFVTARLLCTASFARLSRTSAKRLKVQARWGMYLPSDKIALPFGWPGVIIFPYQAAGRVLFGHCHCRTESYVFLTWRTW